MTNYANGRTQRERLFSRLLIDPSTGCLNWTGGRTDQGYGIVRFNGQTVGPHRAMYELFAGPVPDGMELDHLCRNRLCANVAHLEAVTHRENIRRGIGPVSARANQTHCIRGHEFDEADTYWRSNGTRACKPCRPFRPAARKVAAS